MSLDIVNIFLTFWLKPMLLLALTISIAKNTFRFSASASHWFLTSGFFVTTLGVIFTLVSSNTLIPAVKLEILPHVAEPLTHIVLDQNMSALVISYSLFGAYLLGVFWILSFQFFGLLEIRSISFRSEPIDDRDLAHLLDTVAHETGLNRRGKSLGRPELNVSADIDSPLVWGYFSPLILLPTRWRQWDAGRLRRVLAHELSHIHRNDWLIKMSAKFFIAIFWPLPLAWHVLRKIEWFSELACDDRVIACYDCRTEYAEDLLCVARQNEKTGWAMAFNRQTQLFRRIEYVLDGRNQRTDIDRKGKYFNTCVCIGLILPLFFFHAAPHAAKEDLKYFEVPFVQVGEQKKVQSSAASALFESPEWPHNRNEFIRILPDSPKFLEEMTVNPDIPPALGLDPLKHHSQSADMSLLASVAMLKPSLEVKGVLPRVLHTPSYPRNALRKGIEGQVIVQFDIDERGEVRNPRIVYAQPKKIFESAVLRALAKSKFSPMEIQGRPVITKNISETFSFRLEKP